MNNHAIETNVNASGRLISLAAMLAVVLAAAVPVRASRPAGGPPGYVVRRTADGIQVTVRFQRRTYPKHALIAVTATLHNLSHRHLAVARDWYPYSLCSWPVVSFVSVNAGGQYVPPPGPIPAPAPDCPAPLQHVLPIGQSVVEHQLIVLWTPRLRITAELSNFVHNCYCGFELQGPSVRFHVYRAPAPRISVQNRAGSTMATISPPPGTRGRFFYQSWGSCRNVQGIPNAFYWTARRDRLLFAVCSPVQWHLDVAWLNTPVASLNLGVGHAYHSD